MFAILHAVYKESLCACIFYAAVAHDTYIVIYLTICIVCDRGAGDHPYTDEYPHYLYQILS